MKITYLGHATFLLETGKTKILIDPYNGKVGYPVTPVAADLVLVSHEHGDHTNVAMATGSPRVIRGLADGQWRTVRETVDGIAISSVPTFHDDTQGAQRGRNTVWILEAEGLRVVHLGDLGHLLDDAQVNAIGRPDVLMIPVGGHYTIDAAQAHTVAARLRPGVVVPIHYKTEMNPGSPVTTVEPFLGGARNSRQAGHSVTVEKTKVPKETEVWVMSWK